MNSAPLPADDSVRIALATLADLDRLRASDEPLLATAANRAYCAVARALASVAPHAMDAVP